LRSKIDESAGCVRPPFKNHSAAGSVAWSFSFAPRRSAPRPALDRGRRSVLCATCLAPLFVCPRGQSLLLPCRCTLAACLGALLPRSLRPWQPPQRAVALSASCTLWVPPRRPAFMRTFPLWPPRIVPAGRGETDCATVVVSLPDGSACVAPLRSHPFVLLPPFAAPVPPLLPAGDGAFFFHALGAPPRVP